MVLNHSPEQLRSTRTGAVDLVNVDWVIAAYDSRIVALVPDVK
jgi:hypothetical protein